nr:MAG: coat protein [Cape gooseberry ilarvirus 1]UEP18553.1 MAG: coat protein [Cape gooseberry ilarvirus 1]
MSTSRSRNNNQCPTCFDELDAAANNCSRHGGMNSPSNRQRRNARRAAQYRNIQRVATQSVPLPVPVAPVTRPRRVNFRLPNNQVWVTRKASEWAAKTTDTNDAISLRTILNGIPEISDETRVFRLLIGFVAVSDGTFGLVDGVTGDVVPDPPVVGRLGFQKNKYRCRDFDLEGKTPPNLADKAIVWCLDSGRRDAKRVSLANYWLAISRPAPLMPPSDFLVESD